LWRSTGWWNAANALHVVVDFMARTGDRSYSGDVENTFQRNRRGGFLNEFYDDEGWWALAWIRAFEVTSEARYLDAAQRLFADMQRGWDSACGGGIWWNKQRRYKNAISNELFLSIAARLSQHDGNTLDWAKREHEWLLQSGLVNERFLINDGLTPDCKNNKGVTWTYNQGVILGALVALRAQTEDETLLDLACRIADATIGTLTEEHGILVEPNEPDLGNDGPQFKGIFVRNLRELYDATLHGRYRDFLLANAESIWENSRDGSDFLGVRWTGPFDTADAARQSSGIDALNAVLLL
jgi:predicted alpha-1,6-mannanase (GH76 family)